MDWKKPKIYRGKSGDVNEKGMLNMPTEIHIEDKEKYAQDLRGY